MQQTTRPLLTLVLAALLGLAPVATPAPAAAQGKGEKNGHVKHKKKGHNDFGRSDRGRSDDRSARADRSDDDEDRRDGDPQERRRGRGGAPERIPPGHMPPAGMCRIWIDGVPPGRQPAPTDCATAERNRPSNARVIYGAESAGSVSRRPRGTRTVVRRDTTCADVNRDGRRERVVHIVDGRVTRTVCR